MHISQARLKENVPKTIDNTREKEDTFVEDDEEVAEEEATDEFAQYFSGKAPKILITTSKRATPVCDPAVFKGSQIDSFQTNTLTGFIGML